MVSNSRKAAACSMCGKPRTEKWRPFCSSRCRDMDLFRWLNGGYAIPTEEESDSAEAMDGGAATGGGNDRPAGD